MVSAKERISPSDDHAVAYPRLRLVAMAWLAIYVPSYAAAFGWWHFLFLCNLGITLTALGLVSGNQLLLSSQALLAPGIAILWIADAASKLLTAQFLHGGTAYMWDPSLPALVRALSLYHLLWPALLLYCLWRNGYDRRAFRVQALLVAAVLITALLLAPSSENINYVQRWPGAALAGSRSLVPPVPVLFAILVFGVCWPSHRICMLAFRPCLPAQAPQPAVLPPNAA